MNTAGNEYLKIFRLNKIKYKLKLFPSTWSSKVFKLHNAGQTAVCSDAQRGECKRMNFPKAT